MKRKCVGIDIDCVLANSIDMFIPFLNKRFNKNLELKDIVHYEFEKCYDITPEEIMEAFKDLTKHKIWGDIEPMNGANKFMEYLTQKYDAIIVTSRPEEHMRDITEYWLKKHNFVYTDLLFMSEDEPDKYQTGLKKNYKFDLFIEDCVDFAVNIIKYNIPVLIYDYPWNRVEAASSLIRVCNLDEAIAVIDEKLNIFFGGINNGSSKKTKT